ncbi:MAG: hypothetical protein NW220_23845 [Leptolyngbyaceae cyanobacterium bins.349]|nr:hypothetical protein [Leptolyngbyaceae cyanobacterium bins.349]
MMRPTGVVILAVLQTIFSVQILLAGLGMVWGAVSLSQNSDRLVSQYWVPMLVLAAVILVTGGLGLWVAWGLFKLKQWAWLPTLVFQGLFLLVVVPGFLPSLHPILFLAIALSGSILYYLLRPEVKQLFGR